MLTPATQQRKLFWEDVWQHRHVLRDTLPTVPILLIVPLPSPSPSITRSFLLSPSLTFLSLSLWLSLYPPPFPCLSLALSSSICLSLSLCMPLSQCVTLFIPLFPTQFLWNHLPFSSILYSSFLSPSLSLTGGCRVMSDAIYKPAIPSRNYTSQSSPPVQNYTELQDIRLQNEHTQP